MINVINPEDFQSFIDAEWKIINKKYENIVNSGANVVLSKLPFGDLGDLATQYFAEVMSFTQEEFSSKKCKEYQR